MRRSIAVAMIFSMSYATVGFAGGPLLTSSMRAAQQLGRTAGQPLQQVEALGVGATVKVKLATGEKLEGSIAAIDAESFDLISRRDGLLHRVTYGDVAELKFTKSTYRAGGSPDATEARRVAAGLVGRHVAVRVASNTTYRGHVQKVSDESLVLTLDEAHRPVEIPYGEVRELGPNLSRVAKNAFWGVGIVLSLVIVLTLMEIAEESCPTDSRQPCNIGNF